MSLLISVRSDTLKIKRTISIYLCLLAAFFGPFMTFMEYIDLGPKPPKGLPWTDHFLRGHEPLCIALLPFYVILICTLLMQIEYRDKTWKQVLSSPQTRINIFLAKFISVQIMILAMLVGYNLFLILAAIGAELMHPSLYEGKIDWFKILMKNAQAYVLILGMSTIQFWLALRFKNFIAPVGIGIALWFLSPMMIFQFKWSIVEFYPHAFIVLSVLSKYEANVGTYQLYSIATTLLFLTIAFADFRSRKAFAH